MISLTIKRKNYILKSLNQFSKWERGSKLTIEGIAKLAGVSKGTVSRVINNKPEGVSEETRKRIQDIIEEVGYVPNLMARSITVAQTKTIGLIIPDVQNPFFAQVIRGVEDCAMQYGYTVFLCNSDSNIEKEKKYLFQFLQKRVDGIIINTSGEIKHPKLTTLIHNSNVPVVLLDRKTSDFAKYPGVYVDNFSAAMKGTLFLIDNGNQDIAYLGGDPVQTTLDRYEGFSKAHKERNLEPRKELISFGEHNIASGYERTKELLLLEKRPDAIFAGSDIIAVGVCRALREANIQVPREIEILGFDNIWICDAVTPTLSTIAQPIYEIGYVAAEKIMNSILIKEQKQEDEYLETHLILRDSTRRQENMS